MFEFSALLLYKPLFQSFREFLTQMGVGLRLRRLLDECTSRTDQENLIKAYNLLIDEHGMGTRFKAMCLFPKTLNNIIEVRGGTPAGFGTKETKHLNIALERHHGEDEVHSTRFPSE